MQIVRMQARVVCTVFIRDSPEQISLTILVTGAPRECQFESLLWFP